MNKKLIILNGAPGSGKSTILHALREYLDITIIEKDAIKEFLFNYIGVGDRAWSRVLGKVSIDAMFSLVDQLFNVKDALLIETAFYAPATRQDLERVAQNHDFDILEIYCQVDEAERQRRFAARAATNRHPGHADLLSPTEAADNIDRYVPLGVGEIMYVNTGEDVDIERIVHAVTVFCKK